MAQATHQQAVERSKMTRCSSQSNSKEAQSLQMLTNLTAKQRIANSIKHLL